MNLLDFDGIDNEVLKSLITNVEIMNSKNMVSQYANTGHRKAVNLKINW